MTFFGAKFIKMNCQFICILDFKPFGLEFQNSRCLFTEFANFIHFGRKNFFCRKTLTQTDGHTDGNTHRHRSSNSSLDKHQLHKSPNQIEKFIGYSQLSKKVAQKLLKNVTAIRYISWIILVQQQSSGIEQGSRISEGRNSS